MVTSCKIEEATYIIVGRQLELPHLIKNGGVKFLGK